MQRPNSLEQAGLIVVALIPLAVVGVIFVFAGYVMEAKRVAGGG